MKTKKYIIAVISIFCYSFCYAQLIQFTPTTEMVTNYSQTIPYIFEATVIQQTFRHSGILSFCNLVQITKIFKGSPQLKLGTIKVLSDGGGDDAGPGLVKGCKYIIFGKLTNSKTFDDIVTNNAFVLWKYDQINFPDNVYHDIRKNENIQSEQVDSILKYSTVIHRDSNDYAVTHNVIISTYDSRSSHNRNQPSHIFVLFHGPAAQWSGGKFPTLDSLYSFLKEGGLTVQEEAEQK
jgi:hypothetical protein